MHSTFNQLSYYDMIFDVYTLIHLFGHATIGFATGDFMFAFRISFLFEFIELMYHDLIPNFKECFFDHFILDLLICNAIGAFLGVQLRKFYGVKIRSKYTKYDALLFALLKLLGFLLKHVFQYEVLSLWNMSFCILSWIIAYFSQKDRQIVIWPIFKAVLLGSVCIFTYLIHQQLPIDVYILGFGGLVVNSLDYGNSKFFEILSYSMLSIMGIIQMYRIM